MAPSKDRGYPLWVTLQQIDGKATFVSPHVHRDNPYLLVITDVHNSTDLGV
jgi:hypothetical protein